MTRAISRLAFLLMIAFSLAAYMYLFAPGKAGGPVHETASARSGIIRTTMTAPSDATTPDGGRYYGALVDGKLHGRGIIEWANGDRYEGEFKDGRFSGKGTLRTAGYTYEGEFKVGMMAGQGRFAVPGGHVYAGQFADDRFHGQGRYEYDGNIYEGAFVNDKFDGAGKLTSSDYVYQGSFKDGKYHGQGQTIYKDGRKYTGSYADGLFHGKGRYETSDKLVYEGNFDQAEFSGQGTYQGRDGSRYVGAFKDWRYHGQGKLTDARGDVYEGSFEHGRLNGKGVRTGKDGSRYQGDFENGQFHGQGTYTDADGGEYKGEFKHGYFDGQGTYTYAVPQEDGRTKDTGVWRYGELEDKAAEQRTKANVETALYNQRALLDKAFAGLAANDPNKIDMYLLAIGGDGSQEVFRREVEFVQKQFDRDFGTQGKSLALFNSRNTVASVPMATVTSIRESLAAIAAKMDRENDILFLFLTSHGSRDHKLSLNQNGMALPDLDAKELGELLKASGIRWKLAVISACYSGGFIDPIKDKYTTVMTAARHDRTSFGCADENDFTYFGKAFFHDALPKAASFEDAFKKAKILIKQREVEELADPAGEGAGKIQHSEPQIRKSALLEKHFRKWRAQREAAQDGAVNNKK